ncbi:MAG: thioredoxin [Proteobacteria bacterium]|nr:thioredoxin [Desulfobacula sp.]MBU3954011.1 thioredoxin [Pseudomonadota bacterium]MBU4129770.1 thioredoxin [Pseudomonadota bacterium]
MDMKQFQFSLKNKVVLVDFGATWCGPCKSMEPIITDMIKKYKGRATIFKINIDDQKSLATDYMVQSIPTLILFSDGREVKRLVGLQSAANIEKSLNEALGIH